MNKVVVIGNAGGGKSKLARSIYQELSLPLHEIDKLQWQPGWVPTPEGTFNHLHREIISSESWLLDGYGPWNSVLARLDAADTIIFVDLPIWRHYWWATKRQIRSIFFGRPDGPKDCPLFPVTIELYKMMWVVHKELRPKLLNELAKVQSKKTLIWLRSPRALNNYLTQFQK